jgi:branched-subunit amino acid ABC-type transport system permease component
MSGSVELGQLTLTWNRLYIIAFAMAVFAALYFAMRYTSFGLQMRAVVQNRRMAGSMGIRTKWVDALTFGLGSGIAGIAGVASARSTTSARTSVRATSSTASWWWYSGASETSGARWLAR